MIKSDVIKCDKCKSKNDVDRHNFFEAFSCYLCLVCGNEINIELFNNPTYKIFYLVDLELKRFESGGDVFLENDVLTHVERKTLVN